MQNEPPSSGPPPQYVAYPRDQQMYGAVDKLQALADGYFGLNKVFILNVVLALALRAIGLVRMDASEALLAILGIVLVMGLTIGFLTYPYNKKIGYGCNWSPAGPVIASVLMGLNSALCCGIIGYIVMQTIASAEMKKYGIKTGIFGMTKKNVDARINELRAMSQPRPPAAPPF